MLIKSNVEYLFAFLILFRENLNYCPYSTNFNNNNTKSATSKAQLIHTHIPKQLLIINGY